jgi:hypothetical protein
MTKKSDQARTNEVRRIFQKLYPHATPHDVAVFHGWLEQNGRDLLIDPSRGDSYQQLKSDLQGLSNNPPPQPAKKRKR